MFLDKIELDKKIPKVLVGETNKLFDDSWENTAIVLLYNRLDNFKVSSTYSNQASLDPTVYSLDLFFNFIPDAELEKIYGSKPVSLLQHEKYVNKVTSADVKIRLFNDKNTVLVMMNKTCDLKTYHLLVSFLPAYFPIFKEKPITNDERNFLESLTEIRSKLYYERFENLTTSESFYNFKRKYWLMNFDAKLYERKLKAAEDRQRQARAEMENALRDYSKAYKEFEEANIWYNGLKFSSQDNSQNEEITSYLLNNKNIIILNAEDAKLDMDVLTYLDPYDVEDYKNITKHDYYFRSLAGWNPHINKDEAKLLLDAVFSEKRCLKLRMCANIVLDFEGATCKANKLHNCAKDSACLKNYVPNPHLFYYNCFGQNSADIVYNVTSGDLVGAVECAINSVKQVNVAEDASFSKLIKDIAEFKEKCFVTKTGEEMTVMEAIDYLKKVQNV